MKSYSDSYLKAGVDINAGYRAVELIKPHTARTMPTGLTEIGGFGGAFPLDITGMSSPVLVSGTDGVGTKLKLAFTMDKHDTVGVDCVAMCVNDVVCCGAKPLFFLDYLALGKNVPERVEKIVTGVADGCVEAGCALIGGETAEMPGFYPQDEYDLAGFTVGVVDKSKLLDKDSVASGDAIVALRSSGVHSNGFSLVRKTFSLDSNPNVLSNYIDALGCTLGEALLKPTRIYVKSVLDLCDAGLLKSAAHITGGGFYENIPRCLPRNISAKIDKSALEIPAIFELIAKTGDIPERDMFNTFNMGVGMCLIVAPENIEKALAILKDAGEDPYVIGSTFESSCGVEIC